MSETWSAAVADSFNRFLEKIITFLPNLLAMITILIVGFLVAWIVKKVLLHFVRAIRLDTLSQKWGLTHLLSKGGVTYTPSYVFIQFLYWIIVVITLIFGIDALEVAATQALIAKFFNYLPHLFAAILILVLGYLIASFLGQAALIAAVNLQLASAKLLSQIVRWFIVVLALTMALYQLGIAERVIIVAFTIIFGGVVLALVIAFGWGGRDLAKEFLEKRFKGKQPEEKGPEEDRISHI